MAKTKSIDELRKDLANAHVPQDVIEKIVADFEATLANGYKISRSPGYAKTVDNLLEVKGDSTRTKLLIIYSAIKCLIPDTDTEAGFFLDTIKNENFPELEFLKIIARSMTWKEKDYQGSLTKVLESLPSDIIPMENVNIADHMPEEQPVEEQPVEEQPVEEREYPTATSLRGKIQKK